MTEVVAALIWDRDQFMICQRPAHKARGLLWEFVGGKIEPGETAEEALIRECREELDVTIAVGSVFMEVVHTYPDLTVHLTLFHASILDGTPKLLEHNAIEWISVNEIDCYAFCPADDEILVRIKQSYGSSVANELFLLQDTSYRKFMCQLIPALPPDRIIGVRVPELRKYAQSFVENTEFVHFFQKLPHYFYEENNLHALLINQMHNFDQMIDSLNLFLPHVDNWATCDMLRPVIKREDRERFLPYIHVWLQSSHSYTVRFAIEMLMIHYLEDAFSDTFLTWIAQLDFDDYYVKMMAAWYFAEALFKQPHIALTYLEDNRLPVWVHNKAIQKATESRKISAEQKAVLRLLKR